MKIPKLARNIPEKIEDEMTEYPTIASSKMPVTEAIELMKKHDIRHLPVIEKGIVIGIISDRDLRQAELLSDAMTMVVSDVMTAYPYCVQVGTPLSEVAYEMAKHKYGCVVILNRISRVVGIFTTTDGMRVLSEILNNGVGPDLKMMAVEELLSAPIRAAWA